MIPFCSIDTCQCLASSQPASMMHAVVNDVGCYINDSQGRDDYSAGDGEEDGEYQFAAYAAFFA